MQCCVCVVLGGRVKRKQVVTGRKGWVYATIEGTGSGRYEAPEARAACSAYVE